MSARKAIPKETRALVQATTELARNLRITKILVHSSGVAASRSLLKNLAEVGDVIVSARDEEQAHSLEQQGFRTVKAPAYAMERMDQIKDLLISALSASHIKKKDRVICVTGPSSKESPDCVFLINMAEQDIIRRPTLDLMNLAGDIKPQVLEIVLDIALQLSFQGREGKAVGALFVVGDSMNVMSHSRQMIFNPFKGYPEEERNILDPKTHEAVKEFASIDGAFIIRSDGLVVAAGRHLEPGAVDSSVMEELPPGLGARHSAAAGITAISEAVAVVVSESTGAVRVFKKGKIVLKYQQAAPLAIRRSPRQ